MRQTAIRSALKALGLAEVSTIKLARLKPDDIVVLECKGLVSGAGAKNIERAVKSVFGEKRRVMVLEGGMKLKVARA